MEGMHDISFAPNDYRKELLLLQKPSQQNQVSKTKSAKPSQQNQVSKTK
jgi:hypothetical protein